MALGSEPVFQRLALEVRYREGMVYMDRCGSLMVALEGDLGKAFKGSVPTIEGAHLRSHAERLVVRYGPASFGVEQSWAETTARFSRIATLAWDRVARVLDVAKKVTRCGLRAWIQWETPSMEEAYRVIETSGLAVASARWSGIFGKPTAVTFTGISRVAGGHSCRAALDAVRTEVEGRVFPDEKKFVPPFALQLDVDLSFEVETGALSQGLKSFVDDSVEDVHRLTSKLGEVLRAG
jgi:hypothetical protein